MTTQANVKTLDLVDRIKQMIAMRQYLGAKGDAVEDLLVACWDALEAGHGEQPTNAMIEAGVQAEFNSRNLTRSDQCRAIYLAMEDARQSRGLHG